ncbi:MAG: flagellar biosynthesis protein FlhB [Deltaproteobacteria bacterium]|nr:flagellar biosynthesis protein FlhB [Deltaproteobacteria bacterium]
MAEEPFGERTEKATEKRRTEARKKGQVARSREIPSVMILLTGLSVLFLLSTYFYQQLSGLMVQLLQRTGTLTVNPANIQVLTGEIAWFLFKVLSPIFLALMAAGILSNYMQVGHLFSLEVIQPKLSKLSFIKGISRLFSKQAAAELIKSILKIMIIGWVAYSTIREEMPSILTLLNQEVGSQFQYIGVVVFRLFLKTLLVMSGLAALDYVFQRWSHEKSLRMAKREVKEELKQSEGDPLIKARIRSIQRELARKRMMAELPRADVIITNPTHLAVALNYKSEVMNAPKVVAKGAGLIAEKIKEIGRTHQIPLVENKPLAQVLFKTVEIGQTIPSALYQAVADILAYVYRMKNKTF